MNAAKPVPLPFRPTETRLREIDAQARRVRELDRREAHLLETIARLGTWTVHSPFMGAVRWTFGAGGLSVAHNADELGE